MNSILIWNIGIVILFGEEMFLEFVHVISITLQIFLNSNRWPAAKIVAPDRPRFEEQSI